jgi:hypothetical protein
MILQLFIYFSHSLTQIIKTIFLVLIEIQIMIKRFSIPSFSSILLIFVLNSCQNSSTAQLKTQAKYPGPVTSVKEEPHQYGGWYCPDNFGFVPVDIQQLSKVPVVNGRFPTKQELQSNMSLIDVDTSKYSDARVLKMDLPRVARINNQSLGMTELIIVIQAIVVQKDTIVGYRFANGGNGSARINKVTFVSKDELAAMGSQPFYYSKSILNASIKDIWNAMRKTEYFKQLGKKFGKQEFFASEWNSKSEARLSIDTIGEKAKGYVGMVFGNYYMQIDYNRNGFHYSEKMLMMENPKDKTTEFFFEGGPYPKDFEKQKLDLDNWVNSVKKASESR